MSTFRLNEYLQLFKSFSIALLKKKNIVWLKAFAIIKRVEAKRPLIPDEINLVVIFFQTFNTSAEIHNKGFLFRRSIVVGVSKPFF